MADKLKPGIAVITKFTEGESVTPAKLNSITAQLKRATENVEDAVGDTLGQSWPYISSSTTKLSLAWGHRRDSGGTLSGTVERSPDIASLARLIGPASNLNPRVPTVTSEVEESVPLGVHEFSLRFMPTENSSASPVFSDTVVFANFKTSRTNLQIAGDYHVTPKGKVYTASETDGGLVTYSVNPRVQNGILAPQGHRFNVIPDPNQLSAGGNGLQFASKDSQNRYPVTIPVVTHQQSDISGTSIILDDEDPHYDLPALLPRVLTDNFTSGDEIPAGFLYLKNYTSNKVYEDAIYYYNGIDSILVGNLEIDDEITKGDKFCLITVGSDITSSIDDLRVKSFHSHNRDNGEPFVDLSGISGFIKDAGNTGSWVPSEIPSNFAPQYLHRDGWDEGVDDNLNDQNALRGHLMIGKSGVTQGNFVGGGGQTHRIYLGSNDAAIYRDVNNDIQILNETPGDIEMNAVALRMNAINSSIEASSAGITLDAGNQEVTSESVHVLNEGFQGNPVGGRVLKMWGTSTSDELPAGSVPKSIFLPATTDIVNGEIMGVDVFVRVEGETYEWVAPHGNNFGDYEYAVRLTNLVGGDGNQVELIFTGSAWSGATQDIDIRYVITYWTA